MTISIWRYSHLALAVSSFLFIILVSVTGIVLAFEPISEKIQPYKTDCFDAVTVAQMLVAIKKTNAEIIDVTVDANSFVIVKSIDNNGKNFTAYADPKSGKTLGEVPKKNRFFQWVTTLHRSLFLHETGRFIIGLTAFLLLLIAASGTILVIQRQNGIRHFFQKIVKENFAQYYHVVLGRLMLVPILIIAITGTYLSLDQFKMLPKQNISHNIDFDHIKSEPKINLADFKVFKNILLSEVTYIEFPFSDDPEDYFTLKLKDRELVVNQFTGDILSEIRYSATTDFISLSLDLHTGRANIIWALVLATAAGNILFFVFSGFAIMLKRRSNRIKNKFKVAESDYVILVGSENGSTFGFANAVHKQLIANGKKSFLSQLNQYDIYPKAAHLIVITSTYGLGNPPSNATKFLSLLEKKPQLQPVNFSVVGFGSHAYPDFCKFAFEVNNALSLQSWAVPFVEIHTINDKSPDDFMKWFSIWSQQANIPFDASADFLHVKPKPTQKIAVIKKTTIAHEDGAFLMRLQFDKKVKFASGDLLAIYPANDYRERLYSIGKIDDGVQLSVRLHPNGLGSGFLYGLEKGAVFNAAISRNPDFYFPKKAPKVIMISNGTGIAPFLGMIGENVKKISCHLYCGFRDPSSFELYSESLQKNIDEGKLNTLNLAYSREGKKQYVKDLLHQDSGFISETLKNGGVIMICGSLAMQQNVIELLENICKSHQKTVSYYQSRKQILADCY
ncbi:hypothetical protein FNO01nite_02320 [Flavobacterium noncentrifugens]|uniref:Sulfite reductase (NADPH) flavoprotein alpha-component n=1 Tax=Flavobacterium noncentrifugens TaxID=1128970 RepID=A0A1G8RSH4_9FLAO|nr:PepSY domain-containing protein [Flavobacterium noncentrifugens]GEP49560.1 hypothetical protein FNO01nite_02320 [Flavobacterium noncentrifugens]SDJ19869.1 sulfite reductase (NADPH) flavoprotein alpha-component [Flavobacterium noncentrifugens]